MILQRGIIDKLTVRFSKLEIVMSSWDKLINEILLKATHYKDEMAKMFCKAIIHIPRDIREAALLYYINK